jgi:hypothetical protein
MLSRLVLLVTCSQSGDLLGYTTHIYSGCSWTIRSAIAGGQLAHCYLEQREVPPVAIIWSFVSQAKIIHAKLLK